MQKGHPIAYISKALSSQHLLLSAYEKELLAIILAGHKWSEYLAHRQFIMKTDQQSLKHLLETKISTSLQQRWLAKLLGYHYDI